MRLPRPLIPIIIGLSLLASACGSEAIPDTGPQQQPGIPTQAESQEALNLLPTKPAETSGLPLPTRAPRVETAKETTSAVAQTPQASPTETEPPQPEIACTSPAPLTPALTEGPYYKQGSPERNNLVEEGMPGTRITIRGYVLTEDCQPVPNAWLDFWQTDAQGEYDNAGYGMRGHQFSDEAGRYELITILPGEYPGRPPHIHLKVQAPNGPVLTSQLFFPGNAADSIFDETLVVPVDERDGELFAEYNFIIRTQ